MSVSVRALMYLAAVALLLMTIFVVLSSVMRYLAGSPFRFTEELVGLLFAAMAFLVWPFSALRGRHIRVTILSERLPPPLRRAANLISTILVVVCCLVFGVQSFDFAAFSYKIRAVSDASGLILFPWMGLMPLVMALFGVTVILDEVVRCLGFEQEDKPIEDFLQ